MQINTYEAFASVIEELDEPEKLKKGFFFTNIAIALSYIVSITAFISVNKNWSKWNVGDFSKFAGDVGGKPMFYVMQVSALIGIFIAICASMITRTFEIQSLPFFNKYPFFFLILQKKPHYFCSDIFLLDSVAKTISTSPSWNGNSQN